MDISRAFKDLDDYKKSIKDIEENLDQLKEDLNNIKIEIEANKENEEKIEELTKKIDEIKKAKKDQQDNLDKVKENFEKSYEELMQIPEMKEIYDEEIANRAKEKYKNLLKINNLYIDFVKNLYDDIQKRRGKAEKIEDLEEERKIEISQENFKEITMAICGDILKRKKLTEKEKNLKEQIIEEYGEEAVKLDEFLKLEAEEIYNKNKNLISEVRKEALEEKLNLSVYRTCNEMRGIQEGTINYAKKINSNKINEYAEEILSNKEFIDDFIDGLKIYAEINGKSEINNYFNNGEIKKEILMILEEKKDIIELILNEYGDIKIREKMGKEASVYKDVAANIYKKVQEKVEDEKEIDKEQNKEEEAETKEKVKTFYRDPEINDTLQLSPEQVNELLRQRAENPEELEFKEDEIKAKNGFFSKFKNWFVRTKNKTNEKEEKEKIEDEEEQRKKEDEQENKQMQEHEEMLEQIEKNRKEYAEKMRELFREKIEQETEKLAKKQKEKNKEDKEREK